MADRFCPQDRFELTPKGRAAVQPTDQRQRRRVGLGSLHPDYEFRPVPHHGHGCFSVHRATGEVCDCKMEWNEDGTILSCPVCGLEGT